MADTPYALNEDGTAKDPVAFQKACTSERTIQIAAFLPSPFPLPSGAVSKASLADVLTKRHGALLSQALRADPAKMAALEKEPEVGKIVLGDDIHAFNQLMKSVYEVPASTKPERPAMRRPSATSPC